MTTSETRLRARLAAHARWAREPDRAASTAPARRAFLARFEAEVDPDGQLAPDERAKRAENAMKVHMTRLALRRVRKDGAA